MQGLHVLNGLEPILCRSVPLQKCFLISTVTIKRQFKTSHKFQEEDCGEF